MSTTDEYEDHTTEQSLQTEDNIPLSAWLIPKPTPRKNLLSPLPQQTTAPDNPPSPLKLYSPSPATQHDSDYKDIAESNEQQTLSETLQEEWDCVILKRMQCSSLVHEHMQICQLKNNINADGNRAFSRKLRE